jgi:DNA-binding HxlR family transcriptional regulator
MSSSTTMAAHSVPAAGKPLDEQTVAALQDAVGVLAAKWSVLVLTSLSSGSHRFTELLRQIDGVSRRMLATTLRQLERDGLVHRQVYARVPARVEYQLSSAGEELLSALVPLAGWGVAHQGVLAEARAHFDHLQRWRAESQELQARTQAATPRIV